jgi:hypothetical protein
METLEDIVVERVRTWFRREAPKLVHRDLNATFEITIGELVWGEDDSMNLAAHFVESRSGDIFVGKVQK